MYDGTPGQLTADSRGQMRSSVEQPAPREIPKGMDNTLTSGVDSGLVQHISNASKQDTPIGSSKTRANSIPTRSSSDGRTLRYSLRVVPPKRTSTFDFQNGYSTQDTSGAKGTGMVTDQPMSDEHFQSIEQGIQVQDHQQQPATIESIVAMIEASKNAKDAPLDIEKQAEEEQHPNFVRQEANVESQSLGIDAPIHDSHQDQTPLGEERETEPSSLSEPHAPVPDMKPSKNDVAQSSKAGGAISNHSTLSSMSQSRASPVLSVRRRRQGSSIQPSEIQWSSKAPSSVNIAENHENEGAPHLTPGLTGKRAVTTGPNSNLTARSGHYRHEAAKGRKIRAETMPSSGMAFGKPNRSGADSPEEASLKQQNAHADQAFSKVITDLEALLQEAINLAGEAANSGGKQDSFENRASGTKRSTNKMVGAAEESDSISSTFDTGQGHFTRRPLEPKGQVRLQEPTKDAAKASPKKHRDATPLLAQSIVPPEVEVDVPGKPSKTHTGELGSKPMEQRAVEREAKDLSPPSVKTNDWAYVRKPSDPVPTPPLQPPLARKTLRDDRSLLARNEGLRGQQRGPVIQTRSSSVRLDGMHFPEKDEMNLPDYDSLSSDSEESAYLADFKESAKQYHPVYQNLSPGDERRNTVIQKDRNDLPRERDDRIEDKEILYHSTAPKSDSPHRDAILKDRHHFSIREPRGFSLSRSHRRKPIARDWSNGRKRFVATVTCITTALLGLVLGIYAGEVPAIQYTLADEHHYTILGNVVLFLGLAASTILFWPLPVLHGRKPYTTAALVILLPLQFPQALAVNSPRSPYVATYRTGILLPRAISGFAMGLANINFMTTLLDLFGASLQSRNPHQEVVNQNDVRRHGGGIGAWLGIWTWCSIMSLGVGFLIGAGIISRDGSSDNERSSVPWGFWITIILNAFVLFLNVIVPEVRRSQYRRSMAEVRTGTDISRRVARGEIKMHLDYTGPKNWFEEVEAGYRLCLRMLKQPGFLVLALYQGWIYGQIVLVIALLGALLSKYYYFRPQYVGLGVFSIPLGALLAVPFQKANILSRSRHHKQRTDSMTFEKRVTWTSHLVRRSIFTIILPFAGLGYTLTSDGSVHFMAPILFAGLIGFLSNLAIAECNGLIMETFDTSDLQPGMTGRPRHVLPEEAKRQRTNFSCFPRVTAGFAIAQTFSFLIAAGATGWGGVVERHLGAQMATAIVAGVLLVLTLLLFAVLWRFKVVQVIPSERYGTNILSGPEDEWKPIIIGNPSGTTRRMNMLELGRMSRWTEIRRRNRLGSI